jgi:pimeloyl-ACP methyl ester carboxylesterase
MKLDTTVIKGDPDRPAAIFIHGLGMEKRIWESPDESRVLGGSFPIGLFINKEPGPETREAAEQQETGKGLFLSDRVRNLTTLFHSLGEQKNTVITWSQKRPSSGIEIAVSELREVIAMYQGYCKAGIILIGHSRGGLVARKYLALGDARVKAMITLATPHRGSKMAQWVEYISHLTSLIAPLLPDSEKGTAAYAVKRVIDFLGSKAVKELLPDSRFFRSLDDERTGQVYYLSVGGNHPTLFSVYRRRIERVRDKDGARPILRPWKVFSVPDILEKVIPPRLLPDELKEGKGDGFVSAESSRIPWADEHYDFALNHAAILFDKRVKKTVVDALNRL